tara:strand:- start:494 stop:718 length:225 start_codon:yes stop_codon:yes gene_type:complete
MKFLKILTLFLLLTNCSFNKNSEFWLEDSVKKKKNDIKLQKILNESSNILTLTIEEFEIFLEDYANNNRYPDIK